MQLDQSAEENIALGRTETDFCVGMQSVVERRFVGSVEIGFNMLVEFFVSVGRWNAEGKAAFGVDEGEEFKFIKELLIHDIVQVAQTESPIPIIHNMSAVHDFSENVDQILEGHFPSLVAFHVFIQDQGTISQVSDIEGIEHIPSNGAESPSFDDS